MAIYAKFNERAQRVMAMAQKEAQNMRHSYVGTEHMLLALITAGIDLSVGSNCVLCTCTIGVMVEKFGITSPVVLILIGLFVSTLCGFINGTLLTRLDLPHPFVSTMGMKNVLLGIALVITGAKSKNANRKITTRNFFHSDVLVVKRCMSLDAKNRLRRRKFARRTVGD